MAKKKVKKIKKIAQRGRQVAKNISLLLGCIALCLIAGYVGSLFTAANISTWYDVLQKPSFTPPSQVFALVWTVLYVFMGIAFYIVLKDTKREYLHAKAVFVFLTSLILNMLWTVLFFSLNDTFWASVEIIVLFFVALWMLILFFKIRKRTFVLLLPYLLRVFFSTYLTISIRYLNFYPGM